MTLDITKIFYSRLINCQKCNFWPQIIERGTYTWSESVYKTTYLTLSSLWRTEDSGILFYVTWKTDRRREEITFIELTLGRWYDINSVRQGSLPTYIHKKGVWVDYRFDCRLWLSVSVLSLRNLTGSGTLHSTESTTVPPSLLERPRTGLRTKHYKIRWSKTTETNTSLSIVCVR